MRSTELLTGREALSSLHVLDAQDVAELPWLAVSGCAGVQQKVLWQLGDFVQALVRYDAGATTPGIAHLAAHHHIWVVTGTVKIADSRLGAGSYLHVPPGVAHAGIAGDAGCTLLQMHRPHAPREAERLAGLH